MKHNFHESLEEAAVALPSERSTGLVLAAASIVVAVVWRHQPLTVAAGLATAGLLAAVSLAAPALLAPVNRAWMGLARLLNRIVSPIVMLVLFCITIVPFGLLMQMRSDPLRHRPTEADETFWIVPEIKFGPEDMSRQF